jgi:hypothetical protein
MLAHTDLLLVIAQVLLPDILVMAPLRYSDLAWFPIRNTGLLRERLPVAEAAWIGMGGSRWQVEFLGTQLFIALGLPSALSMMITVKGTSQFYENRKGTDKRDKSSRPGGFEPPTRGLEIRCSSPLSYGRIANQEPTTTPCTTQNFCITFTGKTASYGRFELVLDSRSKQIADLHQRNSRYYLQ